MTTKRALRGPYRKGVQRREQILSAALEVFAEHGDRGSSLQEIADRVGLSQPGVLHYFGSREELLLAVLEKRDLMSTECLRENATGSVGDAVVRVIRRNSEQPGLVKLSTALSAAAIEPGHPAHEFFSARYHDLVAALADGLRNDQRTGSVRADADAEQLARLLLAIGDGLQVQWLVDPAFDMGSVAAAFVALFQDGPSNPDSDVHQRNSR